MELREAFATTLPNREAEALIIGALLKLHARQTYGEQNARTTVEVNSVGFNSADAYFASELADQYSTKNRLSVKQVAWCQKALRKYLSTQLSDGVEPRQNGRMDTAEEAEVSKTRNPGTNTQTERPADMKVAMLLKESDTIVIKFNYDPILITSVKRLTGRKWNPDKKYWTTPFAGEVVEWLKANEFALSKGIQERISGLSNDVLSGTNTEANIEIPGLTGGELFGFQKAGVAFLNAVRGRGLVADEQGLGKTVQAIAYLHQHREIRPAIIVCPASVKLNWLREIRRWMPDSKATTVSGTKPSGCPNYEIIVINYDVLGAWLETLIEMSPSAVIFDESQFTKSIKAQRTKAAMKLAKVCKHVICLSGTPIVNRPIEFYTTLSMIRRDLFPSWYKYAEQYCGLKRTRFGLETTGATNTEELHERLTRTIMLRRLKKDVLKDLPPIIRSVQPIELANREEYSAAEDNLIAWIKATKGDRAARKSMSAEHLARFEAMKQLAAVGKLTGVVDWIKDYLEGNGGKLVMFATHHKTIDELKAALPEFNPVVIDGRTPQNDRIGIVDTFQTDKSVRLFIGNVKAAGVGLTLTAANAVGFVEFPWTPGDLEQAIARIHRISQESDSVMAYFFCALDTIDEEIMEILDRKRAVLDSVLDGKDTEDEALLTELVRRWEEKGERT